MRLPKLYLRLGAATALILVCTASPVLPHPHDVPLDEAGGAVAQQAGWIHRETLSKTTTITRSQPNPSLSFVPKTRFTQGSGRLLMVDGDEEDDDDTGVYAMEQPSTPPSSLPSDPFTQYIYREDLSDNEDFRGRSKGKRTIIVGDIHGSLVGLETFLRTIKYKHKRDRLIAAGDLVAKGPQSLEVLDRLSSLGAKCVRGNHDDRVLRWRGFLNSLSSEERLELEQSWLLHSQGDVSSTEYDASVPGIRPRGPRSKIPADLIDYTHHYQIAKMMTDKQYEYLMKCPLILTLPKSLSVHKRTIHVTHAGIDPRRDINHQDPWVLINIRNILEDGTPSRRTKRGTGWARLFNKMHNARSISSSSEPLGELEENAADDDDLSDMRLNRNHMIVYGHDAKRSLNVQEWTIGLDSGCVYGRQLSGYIVETGKVYSVDCPDVAEDSEED